MDMQTFRDHTRERKLFNARVLQASLFVLLLLAAVVARLIHLQVEQHEYFTAMSTENRVKLLPLPPTRGLIYDRKGRILAQNEPVHSLVIVPEKVEDLDQTLGELAKLVVLDEDDLRRFHRLREQRRRFENIPLRSALNDREVAIIAVNRHRFPGVDIEARLLRSYPHGVETSHVLGYVGRISERDLREIDESSYSGTSHIGKTGLEKFHEQALHGVVGLQRVEVNVRGRTVKVLEEQPPTPGSDLYLSLDLDLQQEALDALGDNNGAAVAIDPRTGSVLAMVSKPGFDPNLFVEGISSYDYQSLTNSPDNPLFNRALRGRYPPGSTVKPFYGLLGMQAGAIDFEEHIYCPGFYRLPNHDHKYRDWKRRGHGSMNLTEAVVQSCDVYFYELANRVKVQAMHDFLDLFGFGSRSGLDVAGELPGLLPSSEWKRRAYNQPWYPGETLIMGIGQGYFLSTPVELASATATLAARGLHYKPHVVGSFGDPMTGERKAVEPELLTRVTLRDEHLWEQIHASMVKVVEGPRGTARRIQTDRYRIGGKTGTAQVVGIPQDEEYEEGKVPKKFRDHALFIGFAPVEDPSIAVAVIVENGGHGGSVAAPIVRRIMDRYLISEVGP